MNFKIEWIEKLYIADKIGERTALTLYVFATLFYFFPLLLFFAILDKLKLVK